MKKLLSYLAISIAMILSFGCKDDDKNQGYVAKAVATVNPSSLIDAIAAMYQEWEETSVLPESINVDGTTLTLPEYQYAMCQLMINLKNDDNSQIEVLSYPAAQYPTRDSYDKETIAVFNGPANSFGEGFTEDLADIARRMIAAMPEKGRVPNQTVFSRGSGHIAFSTNRATVCMSRAIATYKNMGKMPETISTEYLASSNNLKGFASQLVSYLDVWRNTIGDVDADGSHCTANGNPWKDVHFIPIPYSGGYQDGTMYSEKYQPYHTITLSGTTYTAAQCWFVALKGILDLITVEGSSLEQTERNTTVHHLGNGKSLNEAIPTFDAATAEWGGYPWYEKSDDPCAINFSDANPCDVNFLIKVIPWFLKRASDLGHIGNYQTFGDNPNNSLVMEPYLGNMSAMRMFLISIRFYKYLLDNNITSNVYDAVKDVNFDYDLYGVEGAELETTLADLQFVAAGESKQITFNSTVDWTVTSDASWLSFNPSSGSAASPMTVNVTAEANSGAERTATITIAGGTSTITIAVKQNAMTAATIKDFIQALGSILDLWQNTTGTVNKVTGLNRGEGVDNYLPENDVENAHYIPDDATITVGGKTYNTADMMELVMRCYAMLRGFNGNFTDKYGVGTTPKLDPAGNMSTALPETHSYKWGSLPYNEGGSTSTNGDKIGNGGPLMMGSYADPDNAVPNTVKLDIMDNFLERNMNWAIKKDGDISNGSGYPRDPILNYYGNFSAKRAFLAYARILKYALDNNLDNLINVASSKTFSSDLFGAEGGSPGNDNTIKAFAQQFVKILNVWQNTTGTLNSVTGLNRGDGIDNYLPENDIENAHYVPDDATITVSGKSYGTADMMELAMRCYAILRGFDGNYTEKYGVGTTPKLNPAGTMATALPVIHNYKWGSLPYNESGSTATNGDKTGNGGPLMMGDYTHPENAIANTVNIAIMDNFLERNMNWAVNKDGAISNVSGYPRDPINNFYGAFCAKRAFLAFARIFKYALDNNLDNLVGVSADQTFNADLFGVGNVKNVNESYLDALSEAYESFLVNDDLPATIVVNGVTYTKANYTAGAFLLFDKLYNDPSNWKTASIAYPTNYAATSEKKYLTLEQNELTMSAVAWMANSMNNYAEKNNRMPNYCSFGTRTWASDHSGNSTIELNYKVEGDVVVGHISFNDAAVVMARVMNSFKKNDKLPEKVSSWESDYLRSTNNCPINDPVVVAAMNEAIAGCKTDREKAEAIFKYAIDKWEWVDYSNTKKGAVKTINDKAGNCCDLTHATVAMCRAAGIPARYMHGQCYFSSGVIGHVIPHIYVDGQWWICDPSNDNSTFGNPVWKGMETFNGLYIELPF